MSFARMEEGLDTRGPVNLYRFTLSEDEVYLHCDSEGLIQFAGEFYHPTTISREEISDSGDLNRAEMTIRASRTIPVVRRFVDYPPSSVVWLQIFEGHFDDRAVDYLKTWEGKVLNVAVEGYEAKLTCRPASTTLQKPGLRRNYQRLCPHVLYGAECRATREDVSATVETVSGNEIGITAPVGGLPRGSSSYAGGIITWVDLVTGRAQIRSLLRASEPESGTITLRVAGRLSNVPGTVTLNRGCAHTEAACIDWHSNILNYGGQVFIPLENPVNSIATYF